MVDVTNQNGKALLGRSGEFLSENAHIEERYVFAPDGQRYNYIATITDKDVYTRPFTVTIPARKWTANDKPNGWHFEVEKANSPQGNYEHYERICTENNGGFGLGAASPTK